MKTFKTFIAETIYADGQKYGGIIPEIKYLPVSVIHRQELDFRPEVMKVPDEVAANMDFSEPIEVTAFRFAATRGHEDDEVIPEVTLTDGHHRTAAALQTGRKWLPVRVRAVNAKGEKLRALIDMSREIERGMTTNEERIDESISDRGILKAVFVVGLPGAGKSYTISKIRGQVSPLVVNTDRAAEFLGKKWGLDISSKTWSEFKDTTHRMTKKSLSNYVNGMLPLFIDGTSNDVSNILHRIGILESIGYDVGVVFVHASLATAMRRAAERAKTEGRHVEPEFIEQVYRQNKENANYLKSKVEFFKDVENDTDGLDDEEMTHAFKAVQSFFLRPINNPVGKRIVSKMRSSGEKYLVPEMITQENLEHKITGWYKA